MIEFFQGFMDLPVKERVETLAVAGVIFYITFEILYHWRPRKRRKRNA